MPFHSRLRCEQSNTNPGDGLGLAQREDNLDKEGKFDPIGPNGNR